jgi:CO/xanthine dehydrogenase Mo-binding subunit
MNKTISNPTQKIDALSIVTGQALYTDDLILNNNTLIIKLLRSPHAFAKIKSVDTRIASKVPGVEAIFTHLDTPQTRFTLAGQSYPEPSPYDRRILDEYVRYVGDPVAIVAADTEKNAEKALKLIKVEYELLEPVLDFEKAIDNPTVVHPEEVHLNWDIGMERDRNIVSKYFQEKEGVDKGFEESELIFERRYYTQPQIQAMMETQRTSCHLDSNGRLVVTTSTQVPFHVKRHLARALELSPSKIKVIKPRIGGGFGAKQTVSSEIYPAFVTMKTGKPSKIIFSRKEAHTCATSRHAMRLDIKIGTSKSGYIRAIDIKVLSNTGAYGEHASTVTPLVAFKTFPLYEKVPMRFSADIVYTNTMVAGAFRGYGATQGTFALESALNELAHELKIDPTELREKNLVDCNNTTVSGNIKKCMKIGKELFDWEEKSKVRDMGNGKVRSAGMAVTMQGSGIGGVDTAAATLKLNDSGEFTLFVGATDMGQGSDTTLSKMAAEVLDVPLSLVTLHSVDTDLSPYDPGAYASSGTYVSGNAVIIAANKMKEKIKELRERLNAPEDEVSLKELAWRAVSFEGMEQITVTGTWGGENSPPPFIAGFAEVEVDTLTGEVELLNYLSVVDCGTVISPNLARVQVEGGTVQGIGLALFEDIQYDKKNGKVLNDTLMQYKIPSRKDIGNIDVHFHISNEPTGPFGAKSIGEIVINTPAPAIADAVFKASGVRVRSLPITSEKIFIGGINR